MLKKILLSLLLAYTLIGFIVVPLVLKPQITEIVSKQTNGSLSIGSIFFDPFAFYISFSDLSLKDHNNEEILSLKLVAANLEFYSLFSKAIHLKKIIIEEPDVSLVLNKEKKLNFSSLLKETPKEQKSDDNTSTEMPRIIIDRFALIKGSVAYEDYTRGDKFEFGLDNLGFELNNIDTNDFNSSDAELRFYTKLSDGGFVDLKSNIVGFEPLALQGSLDYEASKLYTQWRYVKDMLNLEVADGKLSLHADYSVNLADLSAMTVSNGLLNLETLRIKPKGNHKDNLGLRSLRFENINMKPLAQELNIEKITLNDLRVKVKRESNGEIDWQKYIQINTPQKTMDEIADSNNSEGNTTSKPWNVKVESIALENIQTKFDDLAISPSVSSDLNDLDLYVKNLTLNGETPFEYSLNFTLNKEFECESKGYLKHKVLDARSHVKCSDFDFTHYLPYIDDIARKSLDTYNVKLVSLQAGFDANITAQDINQTIALKLDQANVYLDKFALNKRSTNRRLLTFSDLDILGIELDTLTKDINISKTIFKYPHIRASRLNDGSMSLENLVVPKKTKKKKDIKLTANAKKEEPFRVRMKKFALQGARVSFEDKMLTPSVHSKIDSIYLSAYNIDSKKYTWMQYYLSARINGEGKLKANGNFRHTPLRQKGKVELNKLGLKHLNPYVDEHAYVYLDDGYLSFKAKTKYAKSLKNPDLNVDGSFKIENFFLNDSRDKSTLISFNELRLKSFTLEAIPNRFFVDEIDLGSFYVKALIDANKTMNLATLVKSDENISAEVNSTSEIDLQNDENKTTQVKLDEITVEEKKDPFPVKIAKVNIKNGNAIFADASLPINFRTEIHDLNGAVYSVSSSPNETSYVDIKGEIDQYGSTVLKGSVNAANPKAYTDLSFNFKNLDLSAMSGYSATFAGYKIDDGKLFLDLDYNIKESELKAENSIIVKKIKLGDELVVEGGSSLPLGFVIGLLEDSDGVIDIDMPIRGNVDQPDFKYGALVWKTLGNLILKAVASPFKFLGAMLGIGGEELEYAEFEAGSIEISPVEREKLDNVVKLLTKRPKMELSIAGRYNTKADTFALQEKRLIELVVKESGAKNELERKNAMSIDLLEDIYEDIVGNDDKIEKIEDTLEKKYDNDEKFERAYLQALVQECIVIQDVKVDEVYALATARSEAIYSYLLEKGIEDKRMKQLSIEELELDETKLIRTKLEVNVP